MQSGKKTATLDQLENKAGTERDLKPGEEDEAACGGGGGRKREEGGEEVGNGSVNLDMDNLKVVQW